MPPSEAHTGLEPTILVHYTQRGALLVKHALTAFTAHEHLSETDQTAYELLIAAVQWPGPEERTVVVPDPPRTPAMSNDPVWLKGYKAGWYAKHQTERTG